MLYLQWKCSFKSRNFTLGRREVTVQRRRNLLNWSQEIIRQNDDIIQEIKEKCYVKHVESFPETQYKLPDGN
jgi:hypothetical protein